MDFEYYKKLAEAKMGGKRFHHSLMVAEEAAALAKLYHGDDEKAKLAGILHDITKEATLHEQLHLIKKYDIILDDVEKNAKTLLHAITGSAYVFGELKINDTDIKNAISYHTTGRAGMSLLEKIIFVADFTSAEREYDGVDIMRGLAKQSLEKAMLFGVSFSINDLIRRGMPVHINAINLYNELASNKNLTI
jgi:nicotinate-nucleotide adenylyltransferase